MKNIIKLGNLFPFTYNAFIAKHTDVICPLHINSEYEVVIVCGGAVAMQIQGKEYILRNRECIFVLPYETHSFATPEQSECFVILFNPKIVNSFFRQNKTPKSRTSLLPSSLYEYLISNREGEYFDDLRAKAIAYPILAEISKQCDFENSVREQNTLFIKAVKYINENYTEEINISCIAKQIKCSTASLSRAFKQSSGITAIHYLTLLRLERAKDLLTSSDCSITDVAFYSGFSTTRNFNIVFSKFCGVSPSEYRRKRSVNTESAENQKL
ncbi:MAG: AraC family transcriptional regulator [Candidatus Borkfalkiaceae bacterium]|nr:AraC family transcriptional regulator [Clostridia bacterium]MDY6222557.1 AraC family transcriptional regulator [Christensenellaceae bacterium]